MTADALTTRIAVAIHGHTPPDPDAALALHRDAAERVVAALGELADDEATCAAIAVRQGLMPDDGWIWEERLTSVSATLRDLAGGAA